MKLGYNEATCMQRSSLENDLRLCIAYGYDYIELRIDMLEDYLSTHSVETLRAFFQRSQVKPYSINAIDHINFNTPEQWEQIRKQILFGCEIAQAIDCPYLIVCPSKSDTYFTGTEKQVFDDTVAVLNRYADIAESYGVCIAFEPVGDRRWCCNSLRLATEIIRSVNRESVGLVLDCTNFYMHDKCADLHAIYRIPAGKLFVYHINDCDDKPFGELNQSDRIMPGEGCIPVAAITEAVRTVGYDGPACIELFRPAYWEMEPEEVFALGAECTHPYLRG